VNPQTRKSWIAIVVVLAALALAFGVNRLTSAPGASGDDGGKSPQRAELIARAGLPDCPTTTGSSDVDGGLPSLTFPCLANGPKVNMAKLRGPVLVNIWAGTCPPCRAEAPVLARFARAAGGKVGVLGVVDGAYTGETWDDALDASRGLGLGYPSVFDADGKLVDWVRSGGIPVTLFVDEHGAIVHRVIGPLTPATLSQASAQYFDVDVPASDLAPAT
jgi:thiol-disulfide isomerase/thioredoxin